jgi:hypothetical protein
VAELKLRKTKSVWQEIGKCKAVKNYGTTVGYILDMPKKKAKKSKKAVETTTVRQDYLRNRNAMLVDFRACLVEVRRPHPSVGGEIAGMNFQQLSAYSVFNSIIEQEKYIAYTEKYKQEYVVLAEEKVILQTMIKEAQAVYGDQYQLNYDEVKED